MRKVMWLIGLLVIANIVLFLMPHKEINEPHVYEEQADLNSDLLSLLNEDGQPIVDTSTADELVEVVDKPIEQGVSAKTAIIKTTGIKPTGIKTTAVTQEEEQSTKRLVCYRVGPFLQESSLKLAKAILDNAGAQYHESKRESRRAKVYRVYLGAWFDREQLRLAKQDLLQKKITDHFDKKQKDGSWIVSLGIYLNKVSANSELQRFRSQGLQANIRNEQQVLPTNYWLNLDLKGKNTSLIKNLSSMDWGGYAAKLVVSSCS